MISREIFLLDGLVVTLVRTKLVVVVVIALAKLEVLVIGGGSAPDTGVIDILGLSFIRTLAVFSSGDVILVRVGS